MGVLRNFVQHWQLAIVCRQYNHPTDNWSMHHWCICSTNCIRNVWTLPRMGRVSASILQAIFASIFGCEHFQRKTSFFTTAFLLSSNNTIKFQLHLQFFCACHVAEGWFLVPLYFKHYHCWCQCRRGRGCLTAILATTKNSRIYTSLNCVL